MIYFFLLTSLNQTEGGVNILRILSFFSSFALYLSIYLSIYVLFYLSIYLLFYRSILSLSLSLSLSLPLSLSFSTSPSIYPYIYTTTIFPLYQVQGYIVIFLIYRLSSSLTHTSKQSIGPKPYNLTWTSPHQPDSKVQSTSSWVLAGSMM